MSKVIIVVGEQGVGKTKYIKRQMSKMIQGSATHKTFDNGKEILECLTDSRDNHCFFLETNSFDEFDIAQMKGRLPYQNKTKRIVDHPNFMHTVCVKLGGICINTYSLEVNQCSPF